MEDQGLETTVGEVVRGEDSSVEWHNTKAGEVREKRKNQRQVSSDQSPHIEEQSRSKGDILQR